MITNPITTTDPLGDINHRSGGTLLESTTTGAKFASATAGILGGTRTENLEHQQVGLADDFKKGKPIASSVKGHNIRVVQQNSGAVYVEQIDHNSGTKADYEYRTVEPEDLLREMLKGRESLGELVRVELNSGENDYLTQRCGQKVGKGDVYMLDSRTKCFYTLSRDGTFSTGSISMPDRSREGQELGELRSIQGMPGKNGNIFYFNTCIESGDTGRLSCVIDERGEVIRQNGRMIDSMEVLRNPEAYLLDPIRRREKMPICMITLRGKNSERTIVTAYRSSDGSIQQIPVGDEIREDLKNDRKGHIPDDLAFKTLETQGGFLVGHVSGSRYGYYGYILDHTGSPVIGKTPKGITGPLKTDSKLRKVTTRFIYIPTKTLVKGLHVGNEGIFSARARDIKPDMRGNRLSLH